MHLASSGAESTTTEVDERGMYTKGSTGSWESRHLLKENPERESGRPIFQVIAWYSRSNGAKKSRDSLGYLCARDNRSVSEKG